MSKSMKILLKINIGLLALIGWYFAFFGANANDIEFSVYNPSNWTEQNIFFNFYRTVSSTLDCPFYYKGTMTYYNPNNFIFNNFFQYFSGF